MNIFEMIKNVKTLQSDLGEIEATGQTGADMVVVTLNGKFEIKELTISAEALKSNDSAVVSELVKAAFRAAIQNVQQQIQQKIGNDSMGGMLSGIFGNNP